MSRWPGLTKEELAKARKRTLDFRAARKRGLSEEAAIDKILTPKERADRERREATAAHYATLRKKRAAAASVDTAAGGETKRDIGQELKDCERALATLKAKQTGGKKKHRQTRVKRKKRKHPKKKKKSRRKKKKSRRKKKKQKRTRKHRARCWRRTNRHGARYTVCVGSQGQKGVYKRKLR